ncbi:MAG: transcription termination factor Rho [Candidatus Cloacimonetes bacterium]|nr:transcription termination factor Rho [Candidatus Cloacimonadota bacterium]
MGRFYDSRFTIHDSRIYDCIDSFLPISILTYMEKIKELEGIVELSHQNRPGVWIMPFVRELGYYDLDFSTFRKHDLQNGSRIKFTTNGNRIAEIISICDMKPEDYQYRKSKHKQTVISPNQRFDFGASQFPSLRVLDMLVPIGLGARALIISPPRAGKTVFLEQLAIELGKKPEVDKLLVLLIDERPEEVTSFRRNTDAVVYHSDMDNKAETHARLAELMLKNIELELECGNNIVVLLDSLTRLSRATNQDNRRSGSRIMSGGLGTNAMQLPRKLLGQARNLENGGSCTIIATILKDTGSRMDDIIFQEFKGTGNCEIVLDANLAYERIYPALDIRASGTRHEELLLAKDEYEKVQYLRRLLLKRTPQQAINDLLRMMEIHLTNKELLQTL